MINLPDIEKLKSLDLLETFSVNDKTETISMLNADGSISTKTITTHEESFKLKKNKVEKDKYENMRNENGYIKIGERIKYDKQKIRIKPMSLEIDVSKNPQKWKRKKIVKGVIMEKDIPIIEKPKLKLVSSL